LALEEEEVETGTAPQLASNSPPKISPNESLVFIFIELVYHSLKKAIYNKSIMGYKVGLVLQGGGTRSAFTAGVLDTLMENQFVFPYIIGTSAGALQAVNYLSGDVGRSKDIAINLMTDKKFVSLFNLLHFGTLFNFTYLFVEVPKTVIPFNSKAYLASPVRFTVATTGLEDGKAHYFVKGVCPEMWKALAASSSLPLLTWKPVLVEGHPYLDGGPAANIPFRRALEDGCEKIVVVSTRALGFRKAAPKKKHLHQAKLLYKKYPEFLKAYAQESNIYNQDADDLDALEKSGKAFVIRPSQPVTIGRTCRNKAKLDALYHEGADVTRDAISQLRLFLSSPE
jgi:predicted patatin/cPLA2 family phospholipase